MINICSRISNLSDPYVHVLVMMNCAFQNIVYIVFLQMFILFSYIIIFIQQHKNNINWDRIV
jgi:hypothetical protein